MSAAHSSATDVSDVAKCEMAIIYLNPINSQVDIIMKLLIFQAVMSYGVLLAHFNLARVSEPRLPLR